MKIFLRRMLAVFFLCHLPVPMANPYHHPRDLENPHQKNDNEIQRNGREFQLSQRVLFAIQGILSTTTALIPALREGLNMNSSHFSSALPQGEELENQTRRLLGFSLLGTSLLALFALFIFAPESENLPPVVVSVDYRKGDTRYTGKILFRIGTENPEIANLSFYDLCGSFEGREGFSGRAIQLPLQLHNPLQALPFIMGNDTETVLAAFLLMQALCKNVLPAQIPVEEDESIEISMEDVQGGLD